MKQVLTSDRRCSNDKSAFLFLLAMFLLTSLASEQARAVVSPSLVDSAADLDHVVVEVNGERQLVQAESTLHVVKGDRLKLVSAALKNPDHKIQNLNFVGFVPRSASQNAEDRGFEINTGRDLMPRWAVDANQGVYKVEAFSGQKRHGNIQVQIINPELTYAEIEVNGKLRVVRAGEHLILNEQDRFEVKKVQTNVQNDSQEVKFQLVQIGSELDLNGMKLFELRFFRAGDAFARVSLQINKSK